LIILLTAGWCDNMSEIILEGQGLKKYFPVTKGFILSRTTGWVKAVDGVDFYIRQGETLGLVGESGCGKTTLSKVILLLENSDAGTLLFKGRDVFSFDTSELAEYRHSIQCVFQDPYSSLNPRMRVKDIISEPITANKTRVTKESVNTRVAEVLENVGLRPISGSLFPHELSGGQRQRVAIARALAPGSECIILDEPVSALDMSIRAQIMNLLKELQQKFALSYFMIAHDLRVVRYMSDRIAVMYLGKIVETGESEELYVEHLHPYTTALLASSLPSHPDVQNEEIILKGEAPSPLSPPSGCRFHPRCNYAMPVCSESEPPLKGDVKHKVACFLY
jgi:oligopeptide transport system ATP-binding protein